MQTHLVLKLYSQGWETSIFLAKFAEIEKLVGLLTITIPKTSRNYYIPFITGKFLDVIRKITDVLDLYFVVMNIEHRDIGDSDISHLTRK